MPINFGRNPRFGEMALGALMRGRQDRQQAEQFAQNKALALARLNALREQNQEQNALSRRRNQLQELALRQENERFEAGSGLRSAQEQRVRLQNEALGLETQAKQALREGGSIDTPFGSFDPALLDAGLLDDVIRSTASIRAAGIRSSATQGLNDLEKVRLQKEALMLQILQSIFEQQGLIQPNP